MKTDATPPPDHSFRVEQAHHLISFFVGNMGYFNRTMARLDDFQLNTLTWETERYMT